ncbi:MAG: hypothetical protein K8T10_07960 [Candidatus Eremiobacteraeota bacterium]|nr:hypothetical protein [Candidatus Eremiobacteraeota bacterium]
MKNNSFIKCLLIITILLSVIILTFIPALAQNDRLIVGGKRVGPVYLGKPLSQFEKFLGPRKVMNPTLFDYPNKGMALMVKKGIVRGIMVYSPMYKTGKGVKVGGSIKTLKKRYGNYLLTDAGALIYTELGLAFNEKNYKITKILVVPASPDPLLGDKIIVPGQRVGNIKIGMDISIITKHWGNPRAIENIPGSQVKTYTYDHKGMKILVESGMVAGAQILSYKFRTREGITVKNSRNQVIKTYGKRYKQVKDSINYRSLGIGFYFHKGRVISILLSPRME